MKWSPQTTSTTVAAKEKQKTRRKQNCIYPKNNKQPRIMFASERKREREWRGRTEAHDVTGNEQLLVINLLLVAGSSEKLKERKKKEK